MLLFLTRNKNLFSPNKAEEKISSLLSHKELTTGASFGLSHYTLLTLFLISFVLSRLRLCNSSVALSVSSGHKVLYWENI